jgi:hypothetical protein
MTSLWPWFAVAAAGALHGLNPATGWAFGAWGARDGKSRVPWALAAIAAGHAGSVILVAAAVPLALQLGLQFRPVLAQVLAGGLLLVLAVRHFHKPHACIAGLPTGGTAIALWSFIVGTAHGAGWMLVPAFVPICSGDMAVRQITTSGSLLLALTALGVHMSAMLVTTAVMSLGARWAGTRIWR